MLGAGLQEAAALWLGFLHRFAPYGHRYASSAAHHRSVCKRYQDGTSPRDKARRATASSGVDNKSKMSLGDWGAGADWNGLASMAHCRSVCQTIGAGMAAGELIVMPTSSLEIKIGACSSIKRKPFSNNNKTAEYS